MFCTTVPCFHTTNCSVFCTTVPLFPLFSVFESLFRFFLHYCSFFSTTVPFFYKKQRYSIFPFFHNGTKTEQCVLYHCSVFSYHCSVFCTSVPFFSTRNNGTVYPKPIEGTSLQCLEDKEMRPFPTAKEQVTDERVSKRQKTCSYTVFAKCPTHTLIIFFVTNVLMSTTQNVLD